MADDGGTGFDVELPEFFDAFPCEPCRAAESLGHAEQSQQFFVPELIGVHAAEGIHPDGRERLGGGVFALRDFADFLQSANITQINMQSQYCEVLHCGKDSGGSEKREELAGEEADPEYQHGDDEFE